MDKYLELKRKLKIGRYPGDLNDYLKKTRLTALYLSIGISLIIFMFIKNPFFLFSFIILYPLLYGYFLRAIDVKINQLSRDISKELIFAVRFLIVELESGITLFESFKGITENYKTIGIFFREIVDKVELGTSMEDALRESIETVPSDDLRRILWQILNSMSTGGDIANSLRTITDQLVRESQIKIKEYGKKLNPLAMVYMTLTIIAPSIGTILLVIISIFTGISLSFQLLLVIAILVAFVQFMFISMIRMSRPPVDV